MAEGLFAGDVEAMTREEYAAFVAVRCGEAEALSAEFQQNLAALQEIGRARGMWEQGYLTDDQLQRWLAGVGA